MSARLTLEERRRLERRRALPESARADEARAEREAHLASLRLWAAVVLSPDIVACEALLAGVLVPVRRVDPAWVEALGLEGDVELDERLVLRIAAHGPLAQPVTRRTR